MDAVHAKKSSVLQGNNRDSIKRRDHQVTKQPLDSGLLEKFQANSLLGRTGKALGEQGKHLRRSSTEFFRIPFGTGSSSARSDPLPCRLRQCSSFAMQYLNLPQLCDDLLSSQPLLRHLPSPFQAIFTQFTWFRKCRSGQPDGVRNFGSACRRAIPHLHLGQKCASHGLQTVLTSSRLSHLYPF